MLDGGNGPIRTADAEELQEHFNILSHSGLRIGLIMNADKLTIEAANRLLKTLEEPSGQAIIILTSSRPLSLPSTVLGRCLRWRVQAPDRSDVIGWTTRLLSAGGHSEIKENEIIRFVQRMGFSPGRIYRAVEQDEDFSDGIAADVRKLLCASSQGEVLEAAAYLARTKKAKLADVLDCAELELSTMYREQLSKEDLDTEKLREWSATRRGLREALSTARRQAVIGKISLNSQLVMESMGLSRWKESVI
jgi:DNA polymerase III delta prime subunit